MQRDSELVFNWNQVFWGATALLAKLTNAGAYHLLVRSLRPPLLNRDGLSSRLLRSAGHVTKFFGPSAATPCDALPVWVNHVTAYQVSRSSLQAVYVSMCSSSAIHEG